MQRDQRHLLTGNMNLQDNTQRQAGVSGSGFREKKVESESGLKHNDSKIHKTNVFPK